MTAEQNGSPERRAYEKPELVCHGSLAVTTAAVLGNANDAVLTNNALVSGILL